MLCYSNICDVISTTQFLKSDIKNMASGSARLRPDGVKNSLCATCTDLTQAKRRILFLSFWATNFDPMHGLRTPSPPSEGLPTSMHSSPSSSAKVETADSKINLLRKEKTVRKVTLTGQARLAWWNWSTQATAFLLALSLLLQRKTMNTGCDITSAGRHFRFLSNSMEQFLFRRWWY
jgi:hypothetical protein